MNLLVDVPLIEEPSSVESAIDLMISYWYVVAFITIFSVTVIWMGFSRYQNTVDFSEMEDDQTIDDETNEDWEKMVDDVAAWDEDMAVIGKQKKRPTPPAAVARDLRKKPKPPSAVQQDIENNNHVTADTDLKSKRTRKTRASTSIESDDSVEFTHLLESKDKTQSKKLDDDADMIDAIAFITSKPDEKSKKRRPVRRKKSNKDD